MAKENMDGGRAISLFMLGGLSVWGCFLIYRSMDNRINTLERARWEKNDASTGLAPTSDAVKDARRRWASEFAADLREQGLVIVEKEVTS